MTPRDWRAAGYVVAPPADRGLAQPLRRGPLWLAGPFYLTYPLWWAIAGGPTTRRPRAKPPVGPRLTAKHLGSGELVSGGVPLPLLGLVLLLAAPWAVRLVVAGRTAG